MSGAAFAPPGPAVARGEAAFQEARRLRRRASLVSCAVLLVCVLVAAWISEASPARLAEGLPRIGEYLWRLLPSFRAEVFFAGWETDGSFAAWMYRADKWLWLIFETSQMALLGTLFGTAISLLLCFVAARNLSPAPWAYHAARRFLEFCRTVPEIVFALIFVWAFGIGPLAGILAIIIHTAGANGKLFAEVAENADIRPMEGVRAAGGDWFERMRYGVLPQVVPNFSGSVGAGGIGEELYHVIAFNYYEEISAIVVLIILAVASIDLISERLRKGLAATDARVAVG